MGASIGAQVRAAREAAGLSQTALSERASLGRQATIAEIEQGMNADADTLHRIAVALGVTLEIDPAAEAPKRRARRQQ